MPDPKLVDPNKNRVRPVRPQPVPVRTRPPVVEVPPADPHALAQLLANPEARVDLSPDVGWLPPQMQPPMGVSNSRLEQMINAHTPVPQPSVDRVATEALINRRATATGPERAAIDAHLASFQGNPMGLSNDYINRMAQGAQPAPPPADNAAEIARLEALLAQLRARQ